METNWSEIAGDCYAAGVGFAYDLSERLQLSAGTVFTKFLFKDKEVYYTRLGEFEAPKGDNWNNGIGLAYKACRKLTLNLALGATFWKTAGDRPGGPSPASRSRSRPTRIPCRWEPIWICKSKIVERVSDPLTRQGRNRKDRNRI